MMGILYRKQAKLCDQDIIYCQKELVFLCHFLDLFIRFFKRYVV